MEEKGTVERSKRAGGKKKLQANDVTPKTSLRKLSIELQAKTNRKVSYSTIKKTLNDYNIRAFTPIKKSFLFKKNILIRFEKSRQFLLLSHNETKR